MRCFRIIQERRTAVAALGSVFAMMLAVQGASAAAIFSNPITNTNPSASNPFTTGQTVDPNITVSGIGRGPGLSANSGGDRYNATSWSLASMDATDYFTFTLTPNSGFKLDFSSFTYTGQRSGTGPSQFVFRSSIDGFAANIGAPSATGTTISLSAADFQGRTTATEFRFYGWGGTSAAGTFSINDFSFDGTVSAVVTATAGLSTTAVGTSRGTATVDGEDGSFALANVAVGGVADGSVTITGGITASADPILVYLDRAVDGAAFPSIPGVTFTNGTFNFGNGVVYDAVATYSGRPAGTGDFYFNFSGLPTLNNVGIVPESSSLAYLAPVAAVLRRRRK